jgi:hypothetical protein
VIETVQGFLTAISLRRRLMANCSDLMCPGEQPPQAVLFLPRILAMLHRQMILSLFREERIKEASGIDITVLTLA